MQTIAGGVSDCNDFGFNFNSGTFRGFLKLSKECTRDLDAGKPFIEIGRWYLVAITNNATHAVIYQDGQFRDSNTVSIHVYFLCARNEGSGETAHLHRLI